MVSKRPLVDFTDDKSGHVSGCWSCVSYCENLLVYVAECLAVPMDNDPTSEEHREGLVCTVSLAGAENPHVLKQLLSMTRSVGLTSVMKCTRRLRWRQLSMAISPRSTVCQSMPPVCTFQGLTLRLPSFVRDKLVVYQICWFSPHLT